jgi:predicted dinucleotide-binding enzyme
MVEASVIGLGAMGSALARALLRVLSQICFFESLVVCKSLNC